MDDTARIVALQLKVAELERKLAFVMEAVGLKYVEPPVVGATDEVLALLRSGDKISAIKVYRESTKQGLKESLAAIEAIEARLLNR